MTRTLVYSFGRRGAEGGRRDELLLGGKGANLAEMTRIGIPVPPGFTITTEACRHYLAGGSDPASLSSDVAAAMARLETETGRQFGGRQRPLLVSVRSGAPVSMPGMMDTILNLGLNAETVDALAREAGDRRFAYDSYRRFVQMYGEVVLKVPAQAFELLLRRNKAARGVADDTGLDADDLRALTDEFLALIRERTGKPFPDDPETQLWGAIHAVFDSWNTERAIQYRRVHRIPDELATAVSVVAMVYGNMGEDSGTGVAFTRNPATGERTLFGEFLLNAQGEDVVAGIRDPLSLQQMEAALPAAYRELVDVAQRLEHHYRDAQDLEFTVERGTLYLLQTRAAKRTGSAAVRIAVDMVDEGLIDRETALLRVEPEQLDQLLHPRIDPAATVEILARGLPASPGAEAGRVVFDAHTARDWAADGQPVILVRQETSPDDFPGMVAARAILTARGGMTSHAAVVARGMGKCCVVGAQEMDVDEAGHSFTAGDSTVREGDWITVDGTAGRVLAGRVATVAGEVTAEFERIMEWADAYRALGVRANADTEADARRALSFGATGIGLCRTEHMFFDESRIDAMREMIIAPDAPGRRRALDRLLPMQRSDFEAIFRVMDGLPVTIRLLDPPLHEFLPRSEAEIRALAGRLGVDEADLARRIDRLREANPMLGHRGVRLGIVYPEVTEMQVRAIFEAAVAVQREGIQVLPEVMVPLVGLPEELRRQKQLIQATADGVLHAANTTLDYLVGTMIELPRAALVADEIAMDAEFFSFGTNDLTQTTLGISRDDAGNFLPRYIEAGILTDDPFQTLDQAGVGRLVRMATDEGRAAKASLKVGICGEHGGDPRSVAFFHEAGLDYVSCSPFRVPVARLAAAQAALRTAPASQHAAPIRMAPRRVAEPAHRRREASSHALAPEPQPAVALTSAVEGTRDMPGR
jgi:pyruvate, orthophosphate dikinase